MQFLATVFQFNFVLRVLWTILLVAGIFLSLNLAAEEYSDVDLLLRDAAGYLKIAPEKATRTLVQLKTLETKFNQKQNEQYHLLLASSLAFKGMYREEVELVRSFIDQVQDPDVRAGFLYYLSVGHTSLGEYERALVAMNEGILLLPKLVDQESKVRTLQAAIQLLNSFRAYDEAMLYADRIYALEENDKFSVAKCIGIGNRVEINFLRGDSQKARPMLAETIAVCDKHGRKIISIIVKILSSIDMINSGRDEQGISTGLPLLLEFSNKNQNSEYVIRLEEAIARGFLKNSNLLKAERYGLQAYQRAKSENLVQLLEKSSETMAKIKQAQGQLNSALEYYAINLALKEKVLDDQLQKNLAYQRVKFDAQDKANQLTLLEQKNKILTVEKALQQGKNQNLLLWLTLGLVLLTILGAWLVRTLQQKNIFRNSSQIDGLTQVSNRSYFIACAAQLFKNPDSKISLVLFDMDSFKKINDTFGHATGDWVLKTVCYTVKAQLRKTEVFGRLGGEEFAICLPTFTEEEVLALAERCRAAIAAIDTNPSGFSFVITASFGVATRNHGELCSFEETLAAADKALYFSKNEGRDRVTVYQ